MGKNTTTSRDGRADLRHRSDSRKNSPHRGGGSASSRHQKLNDKGKKDLNRKGQSRSKVHIVTNAEVKDRKRSKLDTSASRKRKGGSEGDSRSSSKRNLNVRNSPLNEVKKGSPTREQVVESIRPGGKTNNKFFRVFNRSPSVYQTTVVENSDESTPGSKKKGKDAKPIKDSLPSSLESVSTKKGRKIASALQPTPLFRPPGKPADRPSEEKQKNDKKGPIKLTDDISKTDKKKDSSKKVSSTKSIPSPSPVISEHRNPFKIMLKKQIWRMSKPYIRRNKRLSTLLAENKIDIDKIKIDKVDLSLIDVDQLGIENQTIKKSVIWLLK